MKRFLTLHKYFDLTHSNAWIFIMTLFLLLPRLNAINVAEIDTIPALLGYENVRITNISPDRVSFTHEHGIASLPIEKLPQEIKEKVGLTTEGAEAYRIQLAEQERKLSAKRAANQLVKENKLEFRGELFQTLENGIFLKNVSYTDGSKVERVETYQVVVDGPSTLTPSRPERRETRERRKWEEKVMRITEWPIYVRTRSMPKFDGNIFTATVYPIGTFTYQNRSNETVSVPAYTTSVDEFLAYRGVIVED